MIPKAEYEERDNKEHNISYTGNSNVTTASRTIEYPWQQTGNTISSDTIDINYDKVVFCMKAFSLYPKVHVGKDILKAQLGI